MPGLDFNVHVRFSGLTTIACVLGFPAKGQRAAFLQPSLHSRPSGAFVWADALLSTV